MYPPQAQWAAQPPVFQQLFGQPQLQQTFAAPPVQAAPPLKPRSNAVGITALVLAVLGAVFGSVNGALIIGWILLPAAFVVAIVSLSKSERKWLGIVALVVSIIGTLMAVSALFAAIGKAADEAFGGGESEVLAPAGSGADAAGLGTRENPAPLGSTISGDEFDVVINSVTLNATDQVMAANQFNQPPPEGSAYAVINVTITYKGEGSDSVGWVGFAYVTSSGEVINRSDDWAVPPEPVLDTLAELYTGGTATGNDVIAVPVDDPGLLRVTPGLGADEVFVALQ